MAFSKELEELVEAVIADGEITEKERIALRKRAAKEGIDAEEVEVLVENRLDDIRKRQARATNCPVCQAEIPHGVTICPKCGWQRSKSVDIAASNFIQDFSKGYAIAKKEDRVSAYIEAYPLPNSKSDLIEFAMMLKRMSVERWNGIHISDSNGGSKYRECIDKLKMMYPNDPQAMQVVDNYQRILKYNEDRSHNNGLYFDGCLIAIISFVFAVLICILVCNTIEDWGFTSFVVSYIVGFVAIKIFEKIRIKNNSIPLEDINNLI